MKCEDAQEVAARISIWLDSAAGRRAMDAAAARIETERRRLDGARCVPLATLNDPVTI